MFPLFEIGTHTHSKRFHSEKRALFPFSLLIKRKLGECNFVSKGLYLCILIGKRTSVIGNVSPASEICSNRYCTEYRQMITSLQKQFCLDALDWDAVLGPCFILHSTYLIKLGRKCESLPTVHKLFVIPNGTFKTLYHVSNIINILYICLSLI